MPVKHRTKLTKTEHEKLVAAAERKKYDRTHKQKAARKGNVRKGAKKAGSRLAYD